MAKFLHTTWDPLSRQQCENWQRVPPCRGPGRTKMQYNDNNKHISYIKLCLYRGRSSSCTGKRGRLFVGHRDKKNGPKLPPEEAYFGILLGITTQRGVCEWQAVRRHSRPCPIISAPFVMCRNKDLLADCSKTVENVKKITFEPKGKSRAIP